MHNNGCKRQMCMHEGTRQLYWINKIRKTYSAFILYRNISCFMFQNATYFVQQCNRVCRRNACVEVVEPHDLQQWNHKTCFILLRYSSTTTKPATIVSTMSYSNKRHVQRSTGPPIHRSTKLRICLPVYMVVRKGCL